MRKPARPAVPAPAAPPQTPSRNILLALCALAALLLLGLFSAEISDTDFWWTLRSGQYIVQQHKLPTPDPFAFTTAMAHDHYAGEAITRQFNLTFEWLAQVAFYWAYRAGGFAGVILFRALLLTLFCALGGMVAYWRTGGFYRALAVTLAVAAAVAGTFTLDRSYLFTFVFLGTLIALLERRRWLWVAPPLCLIWANCHGGFFLAWIVLGAYSAEAAWLRWRHQPPPDARRLWAVTAASILISGVNPNGFRVVPVLIALRGSFLQSKLLEWTSPPLWPPSVFSVLLVASVAVAVWAWRRIRVVDALLLAAFAVASLTAQRNIFLIAFWAPVVIVTYPKPWTLSVRLRTAMAAALMMLALVAGIARGSFFQLRVAEWRFPSGAADFLVTHHVAGPMFNTYEYGGYLIWRLWPQERVFIDGRALSESVFLDYAEMLYNRDNAMALLDKYGIEVIVMNAFEYSNGLLYNLAPGLGDPNQHQWTLVYNDAQAVVYMRHPPPGIAALPSLGAVDHLEAECGLHLERQPEYSLCARTLGQVFMRLKDSAKARRWLGDYLALPHPKDSEAEQMMVQLTR